jgi:hypothetical protein
MSAPPPLQDPVHIETRLLIVAEMLEKAVEEVRRTMADIRYAVHADEDPLDDPSDDQQPHPG